MVMGVMAGFAAVTTPASFLAPYLQRGQGARLQVAMAALAKQQHVVLGLWLAKQRTISERWAAKRSSNASHAAALNHPGAQPNPNFSVQRILRWWRCVVFGSDDDDTTMAVSNLSLLEDESRGLQTMCVQNFLALCEVSERYQTACSGDKLSSRLGAVVGCFLAVFAALKVGQVFVSLGLSAAQWAWVGGGTAQQSLLNEEPSAMAVSAGDGGRGVLELVAAWIAELLIGSESVRRTIASGVNGFMTITAIRGFLLVIFRLSSRYMTISAAQTVLLCSLAASAYFVAQILMMRQRDDQVEGVLRRALVGELADAAGHVRLHNVCFAISFVSTMVGERLMQYSKEVLD
jgi:hypothetical protein